MGGVGGMAGNSFMQPQFSQAHQQYQQGGGYQQYPAQQMSFIPLQPQKAEEPKQEQLQPEHQEAAAPAAPPVAELEDVNLRSLV